MRIKTFYAISCFLTVFVYGYAYSQEEPGWEQYKEHFISKDGRVIDYYQESASHSEGQGYGMLLAVMHDDKVLFDQIRVWTKNNLNVREDGLLAWLWGKRSDKRWEVIDYNNATDGDILAAFALIEAVKKWDKQEYKAEALEIIERIRKELAFNWQGRTLLMPAYYGFKKEEGFVINPSYFILPAFRAFAEVDKKPFWDKVYKDCSSILSEASFSTLQLPADWVILKKSGFSIYTERSENYGYEAIRIPLYMSFEVKPEFPAGIKEILSTYDKIGYIPLWVNLVNDSISLKSAPAGFYAVYARVARIMGEDALSDKLFEEARAKLQEEKDDYYSFTLYLLAKGNTN
ncbi:MAG: glycosyl hydrolase family 8 [Deltaproteobacteria bacterium]